MSDAASKNDSSPRLLFSPRENDFSERSWWMVDLDEMGGSSSQGASALVKRCMRMYNWDVAKTRKVLLAYRQFLTLKKEQQDWSATLLSPCFLVDQMWHQHILDVVNYCHDTMLLCGHVVGHNPDGALDVEEKVKRDKTTRQSLLQRFREYDEEIWGQKLREETEAQEKETPAESGFKPSEETHGAASSDEGSGDAVDCRAKLTKSTKGKNEDVTIDIKSRKISAVFKIKDKVRLSSIFEEFAKETGLCVKDFNFSYQGRKINGRCTPNSLAILDHGMIRASSIHTEETPAEETPAEETPAEETPAEETPAEETPAEETPAEETPAEETPAKETPITIRVRDQTGEETYFKIKSTTKMQKVFDVYASRKGVQSDSFRFLLDGEKIQPNETPQQLELDDQDQIDCILNQSGC